MMLLKKFLGFSGLFFCALLLPGAVVGAQDQDSQAQPSQQTPSTTDLEAAPNTYQYPTAPRRRRGISPQPNAQPNNPDPPPNPDPAVNNNPAANTGLRPQAMGSNQTANPVPVTQAPTGQPSGLIGPPAPPPATPETMAPTPAKIVYQNGLLSVESVNARLIDILNGIKSKTGIQFEGIQSTGDRVAGKFGPAPADEVLTSLLEGSRFDYVIIGMPDQPSMVQRVILSPSSAAGALANAPGAASAQQNSDDEDDSEEASTDNSAAQQQGQQPGQARGVSGPKTAEQLLDELKQLQRSQVQNQQNQENQPNQSQPQGQPQSQGQPQPPVVRPH